MRLVSFLNFSLLQCFTAPVCHWFGAVYDWYTICFQLANQADKNYDDMYPLQLLYKSGTDAEYNEAVAKKQTVDPYKQLEFLLIKNSRTAENIV